jgi:hypothetical protein
MRMSKKYTVFATWEMCGELEIEAHSIEDAIERVEYTSQFPDEWLDDFNGRYIDGSFEVNEDLVYHYAKKEKD